MNVVDRAEVMHGPGRIACRLACQAPQKVKPQSLQRAFMNLHIGRRNEDVDMNLKALSTDVLLDVETAILRPETKPGLGYGPLAAMLV